MGSCACDCPSGYEGDACETSLSFDPSVNYLLGTKIDQNPRMYQPRFVLQASETKMYVAGVENLDNRVDGCYDCDWFKEYTKTDGTWSGQFVSPKLRKMEVGGEPKWYRLPGATWYYGATIDVQKKSLYIAHTECVREIDLATLTEVEPAYSGYYTEWNDADTFVADGNGARAHRPQPPNASRAS